MKTVNILPHVYELKTYPDRPSPYVARWRVNGKTRGRSFKNKTQADNFRAALIHAINSRERFSNITGLPQSMETTGVSVASLVKGFVDSKKHVWEARTRESALVPLAEMLICLVTKNAPAPTRTTKKEISMWLMGDDIEDPLYIKYSLNISECSPAVCTDAFDELCYCLEEDGVTRSTKFKASATIIRYRRACAQFFIYVVERELLTKNPWPAGKRGKTTRKERGKGDLRIDLLPTHAQAVETLNAIASHQPRSQAYKVVCSLMYYAGLRPGEARALRIENCGTLTAGQWGQATIDEAAKDAAPGYYLSKSERLGDPKTDARVVSLHPVLVDIILQHIGDRTTGVIASSKTGGFVDQRRLDRAWARARGENTWRPYDLRHAHASMQLRAGIPPVEVARSLGHSVEVLHRVYNGAFPDDTQRAQEKLLGVFQDVTV
jgi:integrase